MKPFTEWTVLPHGRLTRLDDNILGVVGVIKMPLGAITRRMTVVRLADTSLVVYSAIALDEAEMCALEAFGTPRWLIVPNDIHRLDAKIWKDRYPEIRVIAPPGAQKKVEAVVPVDDTHVDFEDPRVEYFVVPGTRGLEAALLVDTGHGKTLVLNELIFNIPDAPGVRGFLFKMMGMTGPEPKITKVFRVREVDDEIALRAQLEVWAKTPRLNRIIVSHGDIIEREAPAVLEKVAETLSH